MRHMTCAVLVGMLIVAGCASPSHDVPEPIQPAAVTVQPAPGRVVRAVCIGWNSVDPLAYNGWSGTLPDCELDATRAASVWSGNGVAATTLLTGAATRSACKAALHASVTGLKSNDLLIVWTSGHGGQTADTGGDEADNLDEYVCAYDGPVLDDTIREWLEKVPSGVCVLWLCDTCHSGGMARSRTPVRFRFRAMPKDMSGQLILISGCTEAGTSESTGQGGVLSNALLGTGPRGHSPASWFRAAKARIAPRGQEPQYLEYGPVTDQFRNGIIVP